MTRLIAVTLAAALGIVTQPANNAWLFLVDDLHVEFVQTGRLRDLLRNAANELIHDGDRYLLRASGPSATSLPSEITADRDLIAPAIRFMTGNGLKAIDMYRSGGAKQEVLYRMTVALDAADSAVTALASDEAPRKAMVFVSWGYDVDEFPSIADRIGALVQRAIANHITIFAIDARGLASPLPDSRIDAAVWQRYVDSSRRSLSLIAEGTGGLVIERANEPETDLKRISAQMR